MKIAKFKYKCRLCGEVYTSGETCEDIAKTCLVYISLGSENKLARLNIGMPPRIIEPHSSCKSGYGIADFLGYVIENKV